MKSLQQLWRQRHMIWERNSAHSPRRMAVNRRIMNGIALTLAFLCFLGVSLAALAEPGSTVLMPLVLIGGNQPPIAAGSHYKTFVNRQLTVSPEEGVLANDADPEQGQLQAELLESVASGVLNFNADGSFQYQPNQGFFGRDEFTYRASDGTAVSNPATVVLTVFVGPLENAPRIETGKIAFSKRVIGTGVKRAHFAYAADFDGDGDRDVIATEYGSVNGGIGGMVAWFENDDLLFNKQVLDPDLAGAYPAHVADLDGDGRPDVLAGGYDSDTFAWYRNNGRASFTRINIDTAADGAHSIITYDLDGDGDLDLVTSGQDGNFISWYENDGANRFAPRMIDSSALGAKRAEVADLDGDGDPDVLGASFDGHEIAWYENDGSRNFNKQVIDDRAAGAYYVEPADIDGDGDIDMFSANRRDDTVAWYRNDGPSGFAKQIVDDGAVEVRTVVAVDMDHDGDVDALAASVDDNTVAWHENDGSGGFSKRVIDSGADGAYAASAVDMDFDGDYDVLSASRNSGEIALHTQFRAHSAAVAKRGTLVIDSELLLTVSAGEGPTSLIYTIDRAPEYGEILLDGAPVPAGGTFRQDDVDNGRVTYRHLGATRKTDSFSFSVAGSGENGAQPAGGVFSININ